MASSSRSTVVAATGAASLLGATSFVATGTPASTSHLRASAVASGPAQQQATFSSQTASLAVAGAAVAGLAASGRKVIGNVKPQLVTMMAFENELGDWASSTAPAESLRPGVARGHSRSFLQKPTVSSTEIAMTYLWIIAFASQFLHVCCVVQDVVSQHSLLFCLFSLLGLLSRFRCFLTRGFNILWLFLLQLFRCLSLCFGGGRRSRSRLRPCRFVGRRRFASCRRSRRCRTSPFARLLSKLGSFFFAPSMVHIRRILHQLGLLGIRIGEASHPGPTGVPSDPWATYLSTRAATTAASSTKLQASTRAKWIDCIFDLSQLDVASLDSPLPILSPDSFSENSTGLCLLTRPLFSAVHKVRSLKPLLVVLPGGRNDDLLQLGFTNSAFSVHWMSIQEGPLGPWARKLITLVQLGAKPILPISLADSPSWDITSSVEFVALLSCRLFPSSDSWNAFLSDSRSVVVSQIRALHTDLTPASTEFYAWSKIDSHTHRVTFRAPSAHKNLLLSASGILVSFIIKLHVSILSQGFSVYPGSKKSRTLFPFGSFPSTRSNRGNPKKSHQTPRTLKQSLRWSPSVVHELPSIRFFTPFHAPQPLAIDL